MKKLILIAILAVFSTPAFADYPIQPSQVPASEQSFIKEYFKQTITFAKKDFWEIEVYLQDGTKVEFQNGNFKEAKDSIYQQQCSQLVFKTPLRSNSKVTT